MQQKYKNVRKNSYEKQEERKICEKQQNSIVDGDTKHFTGNVPNKNKKKRPRGETERKKNSKLADCFESHLGKFKALLVHLCEF